MHDDIAPLLNQTAILFTNALVEFERDGGDISIAENVERVCQSTIDTFLVGHDAPAVTKYLYDFNIELWRSWQKEQDRKAMEFVRLKGQIKSLDDLRVIFEELRRFRDGLSASDEDKL